MSRRYPLVGLRPGCEGRKNGKHEKRNGKYNLCKAGMTPKEIVAVPCVLCGRMFYKRWYADAGQSDFKNRHRIYDLKTLAPYYNNMGLFSAECHGGARWHVGIMNRRESPVEEIALLRELMPDVLLQTLIRETNLFGYRPYPKNSIEHVVANVDIDVWRCFSFLNDVRNMRSGCRGGVEKGTTLRAGNILHLC